MEGFLRAVKGESFFNQNLEGNLPAPLLVLIHFSAAGRHLIKMGAGGIILRPAGNPAVPTLVLTSPNEDEKRVGWGGRTLC